MMNINISKGCVTQFLTLVLLIIIGLIPYITHADPLALTPRDLTESKWTWHSSEGARECQFSIKNGMVYFTYPGALRTWKGPFNSKKMKLIALITQPEGIPAFIPLPVRQEALRRMNPIPFTIEFELKNSKLMTLIYWNNTITRSGSTFKSMSIHVDADEYSVTRRGGYTIGEVNVDDSWLDKRLKKQSEGYQRRIEHTKNIVIPQGKARINQLETSAKQQLEALHTISQKQQTVAARTSAFQKKLHGLLSHRNDDYHELIEQKVQLNKEINAIDAVKQDYLKAGQPKRANSIDRQLTRKRHALEKLTRKIAKTFPQDSQVSATEKELSESVDTLKKLNRQYMRAQTDYENTLYTLERTADSLAYDKLKNEQREKEIAYLKRKPFINEIQLKVDGKLRYHAEIEKDKTFLAQFQKQIEDIDNTLINLKKNQLPQAIRNRGDASKAREEATNNMKKTGESVIEAGDLVADNIMATAVLRAVADVTEVIYAARRGGVYGSLSEALQKATKAYFFTEGTYNANFDESALRKEMYEKANKSPSLNLGQDLENYAIDQTKEAPLEMLKQGALGVFERKNLLKEATDLEKIFDAAPTHGKILDDKAAQALKKLNQTHVNAQLATKNLELSARANSPDLERVKGRYQVAVQERSQALRKLNELKAGQQGVRKNIRKWISQLKNVNKKILDLDRVSLKNMGQVGKDIGVGMLFDAGKLALDQEEKLLWEYFFTKEIAFRGAVMTNRQASNIYWLAFDEIKTLEEQIKVLYNLREQVELERQRYLNGRQEGGGFYVKENREFFDNEKPIELNIMILGYSTPEQVFLERKGETPGKGYKPVAGRPFRTPTLSLNYQHQDGPQLKEHVHQFFFKGKELTSLQKEGALPLRIFKR